MANLTHTTTLSLTVILTIFILCHARIPLTQPEHIPSTTLSESATTDISTIETGVSTIETDNIGVVRFRPIFNRHVHHVYMIHPFVHRFPHRCRHHGKNMVGPRVMLYGNDMVMGGSNRGFDPVDRSRGFVKPFDVRVNGDALTEENFRKISDVLDKQGHVEGGEEMGKKEGGVIDGLFKKVTRKFLDLF